MNSLPLRRFRAFRPGVDKESDRWCSAYPDHVEVFSHIPDGQGGVKPNPEFDTADFELAYGISVKSPVSPSGEIALFSETVCPS